MKQITIANNYPIIKKIASCDLPYQISWDLVKMLDELKPIAEFQTEKRRELIKKYNPKFIPETNEFQFKNTAECLEFRDKQTDLDQLEYDVKAQKIRIPIDFLQDGTIKASELMTLRDGDLIEIYEIPVIKLDPEKTDETKEEESK